MLLHLLIVIALIMIGWAVIRTMLYVCLILVVAALLATIIPHQTEQPFQTSHYEQSD
jgi:hypothetical protein